MMNIIQENFGFNDANIGNTEGFEIEFTDNLTNKIKAVNSSILIIKTLDDYDAQVKLSLNSENEYKLIFENHYEFFETTIRHLKLKFSLCPLHIHKLEHGEDVVKVFGRFKNVYCEEEVCTFHLKYPDLISFMSHDAIRKAL